MTLALTLPGRVSVRVSLVLELATCIIVDRRRVYHRMHILKRSVKVIEFATYIDRHRVSIVDRVLPSVCVF